MSKLDNPELLYCQILFTAPALFVSVPVMLV